MSGYLKTDADNGGVHINSGIPNHAFYLVATAIGVNAYEDAGKIWYSTPYLGKAPRVGRFRNVRGSHSVRGRGPLRRRLEAGCGSGHRPADCRILDAAAPN